MCDAFEMIFRRLDHVEEQNNEIQKNMRLIMLHTACKDNDAPAGSRVPMLLHTSDSRQGTIVKLYNQLHGKCMVMVCLSKSFASCTDALESFPSLSPRHYDAIKMHIGTDAFERLKSIDAESRGLYMTTLAKAYPEGGTCFQYLRDYLLEVAVKQQVPEVLAMNGYCILLSVHEQDAKGNMLAHIMDIVDKVASLCNVSLPTYLELSYAGAFNELEGVMTAYARFDGDGVDREYAQLPMAAMVELNYMLDDSNSFYSSYVRCAHRAGVHVNLHDHKHLIRYDALNEFTS